MSGQPTARSRIEDEAACVRLGVDFAHGLDARHYPAVLQLFAEDGVLDRMGTVFTGQAEIGGFLAARPTGMTTRHLCTNFRIDFEGDDQATGACYVLFFQGTADANASAPTAVGPPSVVEYHDRFIRTAAGWRIRERRIRMAIQAQ